MNGNTWKKFPVFLFLAIGISLLFFARFTNNYFIYDDFRYIENNLYELKEVLLGYNTLRLVSNVIWSPLYAIFGFNPSGYNIFSLILYAGNAVLFSSFVRILFNSRILAFFAGIFFVSSSVGVDAVFWKCSSNALLCVCFYLLTLSSYIRFRREGAKSLWYLSLVWYVLAIFSKEDAASLPVIIMVIELLFLSGEQGRKPVILQVLPYALIVCIYMILNTLVFKWMALAPAELAKFYVIRPLHSLLGGLSAFILSPEGVLRAVNPLAFFAVVAVTAAVLLVKDKKILLFAFCWSIVTFLPQSLTSQGSFDPKYISNSVSRYLYIVSIGPALLYAALLANLKEKINGKIFFIVAVMVIATYGWINYENVQQRGQQWKDGAAPTAQYLSRIGKIMPSFPPNSFVFVKNSPTGRASVQQAMRGYYGNRSITWIVNPDSYQRKPGERAFMIDVDWGTSDINWIQITEPWPMTVGQ